MAVATLGITTTYSVGTASVAVCATNTQRRGLLITNNGAGTVSVGFGTNNAATTGMHTLQAINTTFQANNQLALGPMALNVTGKISTESRLPIGDVALIALTTTSVCSVTEW